MGDHADRLWSEFRKKPPVLRFWMEAGRHGDWQLFKQNTRALLPLTQPCLKGHQMNVPRWPRTLKTFLRWKKSYIFACFKHTCLKLSLSLTPILLLIYSWNAALHQMLYNPCRSLAVVDYQVSAELSTFKNPVPVFASPSAHGIKFILRSQGQGKSKVGVCVGLYRFHQLFLYILIHGPKLTRSKLLITSLQLALALYEQKEEGTDFLTGILPSAFGWRVNRTYLQ